jgi:2-phospho-L-lactate guanylyltransferase
MRIIVVPVKSLSSAKTRLSPFLSPIERATLTLAMLEDVLDAVTALPGWEPWVVSPDEAVLEISLRRGVRPVQETKGPLSAAVRQVEQGATESGAEALAVLLGDTPLVTSEALSAALHTLGPVVVAPSLDEGGTNLLLRRPPRSIGARFGRESFRRHVEAADAKGLPVAVVRRPELAFDLDAPDDILTMLSSDRRRRTSAVCLELDLEDRLRVLA